MTNTVVLPKRKRRPVDKTLPVIMTLLLMMGLVTLFSATYYNAQDGGDALSEVKKQLFGMAVGFAAMLFTSRIPYWFWGRHRVALAGLGLSAVLLVLGAGGLALGAYYAWSEPYRRERLLSFTNPFAKMNDEGYQLSQSLIAFGSGGLFGMGLGCGRQKYAYLPYPESDFIFAIVGEDFGLIGCVAVILLFIAFLFAGMRIALTCPDTFGCLLAAGITCLICVQAFINMGVVVGVLPTTGLPLPFFSAGGTSLSITMAAVGVVLSISRTCEPVLRS